MADPAEADAPAILVVAGEASGDLIAAPIVERLASENPEMRFAGIGGDRMTAAGVRCWNHVRELSVRGYVEVIPALPRILGIRRQLVRRLNPQTVTAYVGVDAPDFNFTIEPIARARAIPSIHYVGPNVWAWRRERIDKVRAAVDHLLLVFPFEKAIWDQAGVPSTYVGHPLAAQVPMSIDRQAARASLGLAPQPGRVICLMPGSRSAEIDYLLTVFLDAAGCLGRRFGRMTFLLPVADPSLRRRIDSCLARHAQGGEVRLVEGRSHDCLAAADAALVASGTATLEAALFRLPMVIAYRLPRLTAILMRSKGGYLPWIGLPNILANDTLVPELLQEAATGSALADALSVQLEDEAGRQRLEQRYAAMHESLRRDTAGVAGAAICATIESVRRRGVH